MCSLTAVGDVFLDLVGIKGIDLGQIPLVDDAGLHPACGHIEFVACHGEFAHGHEVRGAANTCPVLVGRAHEQKIGEVDFVDELDALFEDVLKFLDALVRESFVTGNAAVNQELGMGVLAAKDRCAAGHLALHVQGFEIVGRGNEVGLGFKIVCRMPAEEVCVCEGAELSCLHKGLEACLHGLEIIHLAGTWGHGFGKLGCLFGVCLQSACDIHKVKGVQMVEVHHVVVDLLHAEHKVADIGRIGRNVEAVVSVVTGVFQGSCGSKAMDIGAHAADTLCKMLHIPGVAVFENGFKAPEEGANAAGVGNLAVLHFHFNAQMPFHAGQRIDDNGTRIAALGCFLTHVGPP